MISITDTTGSLAQIDPECGGTVRQIGLPDELLCDPESDVRCDTELFAGRLLLPFADRIAGGRYRWRGTDYQLPINDRASGDAIHGFLYNQSMAVVERGNDRLTLRCNVDSRPGYPWPLTVTVSYRVTGETFLLSMEVLNRGESYAPLTVGWHPYFDFDRSASLTVCASRYIEADDDLRLTGRRPSVAGTAFDFRRSRPIGEQDLDVALELDPGAEHAVRIADSSRSVTITPAGIFSRVQLFTPPGGRGIALEPVSAPGEAFNDSSLGVTELEPGAMVAGSVVIRRGPR
jgi:aldose 1-epimerase